MSLSRMEREEPSAGHAGFPGSESPLSAWLTETNVDETGIDSIAMPWEGREIIDKDSREVLLETLLNALYEWFIV